MFRCKIVRVGRLEKARTTFVDAKLLEGTVNANSRATVVDAPEYSLRVLSVAIVDGRSDGTVTLKIEPPPYELDVLVGAEIIGE